MQLVQFSTTPGLKGKSMDRPVILVIDDQAAILDILSCALTLHGYQPVCASNGQEALAWIQKASQTGQYPAAILLDVLMPVMNGARFLSTLRACWDAPVPIPPIILLTADKSDYNHLGCENVLIKPFHIRDLCEKLELMIHAHSLPVEER
ncbi:MAG TPA: response regulator [Ktedonobacteraceae bacterium]|nr:response regulator [Ktedonobacteraceae bacterium]